MKTYIINNKYKIKANDAIEATKIAEMIEAIKDSKVKDESLGYDGFKYMLKQYSSHPDQIKAIKEKIKYANDLTNEEKKELLNMSDSVRDENPMSYEEAKKYLEAKGMRLTPDLYKQIMSMTKNDSIKDADKFGYAIRRGIVYILCNGEEIDKFPSEEAAEDAGYSLEKMIKYDSIKDSKCYAIKRDGTVYIIDDGEVIEIYPNKQCAMQEEDGLRRMRQIPWKSSFDDSIKDSDEDELNFLIEEERKAIDEYKEAIQKTTNPKLLELYKHILEDELEHIEELQEKEIKE